MEFFNVERVNPATLTDFKPNYIKCVECGNVTEFILMAHSPLPLPIKRIDKDFYMIVGDDTGEVFEYHHATDKSESIVSVRRTLANLRAIINTNCDDVSKIRWVTLTYADNMTDRAVLYNDFKCFWKRFKYYCKKNDINVPEYIAVAEPQGRGAWHMHILWLFPNKAPYIANNEVLEPLWGHGFTKIKAVHGSVDNIGAYFSAYLADIPLDEFQREQGDEADYLVKYNEVSDDDTGEPTKKAFVKGARLRFYPSEMNIYRCSRGIKKPVISKITRDEYEKKKASVGALTFSHACNVVAVGVGVSDVDVKNTICHEYYNKKRR